MFTLAIEKISLVLKSKFAIEELNLSAYRRERK